MIIRTDLTDHYLTAVVAIENIERTQSQPMKILRRDMSHFSSERFNTDAEQFAKLFLENLTETTADNFNNVFDYFTNTYKRIVDQHAPLKCLSRKKQRLHNKPWIAKGIFPQKSTALLIPSKHNLQINSSGILYYNEKINVCKSAKYLGVQIDNDLNFKSHIQLLHNKLSRAVGIMFKVNIFFLKKY